MRFRILTFNEISPRGLARFPPEHYEVSEAVEDPDAVVLRSQDLHDWTLPPSLKAIARAGSGTNNIPLARAAARGIPVFNAPGANANAVAELVIGMLVVAARNVIPAAAFVAGLGAHERATEIESSKGRFAGVEIGGRTLAVIGLGAIGVRVAEAAARLGMRVRGYDPHLGPDAARRLSADVERFDDLRQLVRDADFVTVHVPLLPATTGLIDARCLAAFAPHAWLLNFARERIVDNTAVLAALREHRIRGYACDFPSAELAGEPHVIALPHLGGSTVEAEDNCAIAVVDQLRAFLEDGTIRDAVNFPEVEMTRESEHRVAIANANVPNMLGQISSTMAGAGLNIHNMVNKSRGEMAYTLVDVDSPVDDSLVRELCAIRGVLAVRVL